MKTFHDPEVFARVRRLPSPLALAGRFFDEVARRGEAALDLTGGGRPAPPTPQVLEWWAAASADPGQKGPPNPRGLLALRCAGARFYERVHGVVLDPEREVLGTTGSSAGVAQALLALFSEGESLLAPTPCSPWLPCAAAVAGVEVVPVSVGPGMDFFGALVEAAERAEKRPKGLYINFPSNPTAELATPSLLDKLARFSEARGLFILSDLALSGQGEREASPSMLAAPGARERTVEFTSLSWSLGLPGLRVGFCAGSPTLSKALSMVRAPLHRSACAVEALAASALDGGEGERRSYREGLLLRRDRLVQELSFAGWHVPAPPSTPFAWAPLPEPFRSLGSVEFAMRLLCEAGVAVVPGAVFGKAGDGFVRLSLDADGPPLAAAAERLGAFLRKGPGAR